VQDRVHAILPKERPGDFTQAMMDLGATICRPKAPNCPACPLAADCIAHQSGTPELYPAAKPRRLRPVRYGVAYWIERGDCLWLVRRPSRGMLGGMAALPGPEWSDAPLAPVRPLLASVRHVFTHFVLELSIVAAEAPEGEGWWQPIGSFHDAGLPTLYRRAAELVVRSRCEPRAAA
jgi:A/G-specific adenine glycosylase